MEKPKYPYFSSGPCKKYSSFNFQNLNTALIGRAHKSDGAINRLLEVNQLMKEILNIPTNYEIVLTPGSDTGAVESCIWCMLGERKVDIMSCEYFGKKWTQDLEDLNLDFNLYDARYGESPDLCKYNSNNDLVFVLNATTSGVYIPNLDWISNDREGITICDATSGLFALDVDWNKLDATTFSWQKMLGGEPGFGMIILSPRAINRMNIYHPDRAIPYVLNLKKNKKFNADLLLHGGTVNTFSLLALEDCLYALKDLKEKGGVSYAVNKVKNSYQVIENFVNGHDWIDFLVEDKIVRSPISVTLTLPKFNKEQIQTLIKTLEKENIAFDIRSHFMAPLGLRIWCGPTVDTEDVKLLFDWIEKVAEDMLNL